MDNWFERLTLRLTPNDKKPIIVIDPFKILRFPECLSRLRELDYQIEHVEGGLDLRFSFELRGRGKYLVMFIVEKEFTPLPDIENDAVVVPINLKEIFPHFDPRTLDGLSFNALSTLDGLRIFDTLGTDGTIRVLLENLYHIDLHALRSYTSKERLLSVLIRVLFHSDPPNGAILHYLQGLSRPLFGQQTAKVLSTIEGIREYLQTEWEKYSNNNASLNFQDPLLEESVAHLFVTNQLRPVKVSVNQLESLGKTKNLGFLVEGDEEKVGRFRQVLQYLEERITTIQNQHTEWRKLSTLLGEIGYLADHINDESLLNDYCDILNRLNSRFQIFIQAGYQSLHSTQGRREPIVIHHIMEYMRAQYTGKIAFILIDGMSVIQWHILNQRITTLGNSPHELSSLAWIPTITAWSRQAFFRGAKPDLTTDNSKEESLFRAYWQDKGKSPFQIMYSRFELKEPSLLPDPNIEVVAYVCNDLDTLMHGTILETQQLHQDTCLWIDRSGILELFASLKTKGFTTCITADHGNVSARGRGNLGLPDRQLSRSRSKRHLECVSVEDAQRFRKDHPEIPLGIRENVLYLSDTSAFTSDSRVITHGGSHILEVLIPVGVIE